MNKNQNKAPIPGGIQTYHQGGVIPFTTPTCKKGFGVFDGDKEALGPHTFYNDIPMQIDAGNWCESKCIQGKNAEAGYTGFWGGSKFLLYLWENSEWLASLRNKLEK